MLQHARQDGILPQYCPPTGPCQYGQLCNDTVGSPFWRNCQDLDTSAFAVKFAHHVWKNYLHSSAEKNNFYKKWSSVLELAMNATTSDPNGSGLLWSNVSRPMVGYGFQDTIQKSGVVLYSSLLQWNASRLFNEMATFAKDPTVSNRMSILEQKLFQNVNKLLWNEKDGVYHASNGGIESDKIDVWGNGMAVAMNFANSVQSKSIFLYYQKNQQNIFYQGQVREIALPNNWMSVGYGDASIAEATVLEYQNGGFWATPHHHVLPFIAMYDKEMACRLLNESIMSYRSNGINEWIGPFYPGDTHGATGYIASAAGTYYASEQIRCWEE